MSKIKDTLASKQAQLYVAPTKAMGLGVFCREDIAAGEVIEVAPVLFFSKDDAVHIDKTHLYNYYFSTAFLPKQDSGKHGCLAMGTLSFCNHADDPNAMIEKVVEEPVVLFRLKAKRDIPKDTEIFITYGQVWFTPAP